MKSKHDQILDYIIDQIKSGTWQPGDKLPSQAEWRREHNFKYGPLRGTYLVLKALGYIEGAQGDGVYVCPKERWPK